MERWVQILVGNWVYSKDIVKGTGDIFNSNNKKWPEYLEINQNMKLTFKKQLLNE